MNPVDTGDMWECPDFFPLGNKHVLLISTMGKVRWKVGTYANQRFTPEKEGVVDWGAYYAAKTMLDRNGNRILWGWITETRPDADLIAAGWAGAMSLPRVLSLNAAKRTTNRSRPRRRATSRRPHQHFIATPAPAAASENSRRSPHSRSGRGTRFANFSPRATSSSFICNPKTAQTLPPSPAQTNPAAANFA